MHVYYSPGHAGKSTATLASWYVDEVEGVVDTLASKGVVFERYGEGPIVTDDKGIATFDGGAGSPFLIRRQHPHSPSRVRARCRRCPQKTNNTTLRQPRRVTASRCPRGHGSGEPLILLHGARRDRMSRRPAAAAEAAGFAADLSARAHGRIDRPLSIESTGGDVAAFRAPRPRKGRRLGYSLGSASHCRPPSATPCRAQRVVARPLHARRLVPRNPAGWANGSPGGSDEEPDYHSIPIARGPRLACCSPIWVSGCGRTTLERRWRRVRAARSWSDATRTHRAL